MDFVSDVADKEKKSTAVSVTEVELVAVEVVTVKVYVAWGSIK